jgi:hypothetical protein
MMKPWLDTPLIDRQDFDDLLKRGRFGAWNQQAVDLSQHGYCTLELDDPGFTQDCQQVIGILQQRMASHLEEWDSCRAESLRLQDGWKECAAVRRLALNPRILDLLRCVYGRDPFAFQTLNFATGSEQAIHSDAVHFHSEPHGFMCGVWIPLADVSSDSGPLVYYPGSHRLPYRTAASLGLTPEQVAHEPHPQRFFEPAWQEDVERLCLEAKLFLPPRGQVLIWHANLLHGGSAILNRQARRWSQVVHYYFADCLYTTPLRSFLPEQGGACLRNPFNLATGRQIWSPAEWSQFNSSRPRQFVPDWFLPRGLQKRRFAKRLRGNLELITPSRLSGWAFHPDVPLSEVRLVCGSQLIAMAPIQEERADVTAALQRDGRFGFQIEIPDVRPFCRPGERPQVWALPADCSSRYLLCLSGGSAAETAARLQAALAPELRGLRGHLDGLSPDGSELWGWCYSPNLTGVCVWLHSPGLAPRSVSCTQPRPGMANQGHRENCGFRFSLSAWPEAAGREVWASFDQPGQLRLPPSLPLLLPPCPSR